MTQPLYRKLACLILAIDNCEFAGNVVWRDKHLATLETLVAKHMPSGSGFDEGTKLVLDDSSPDQLVFKTSFHHMNNNGMYSGWTHHTVTVKPSLTYGFTLKISGRDRKNIKDIIADEFQQSLITEVE
jgi:hypothetical protein